MKRLPALSRLHALVAPVVFFLIPFAAGAESPGVMTGIDALRATIAASSLSTREVLLFSPEDHVADLFLPLYREKKVGALAVVVPSQSSMTDGNLAAWKRYVATVSPGADNTFVLRNGALDGSVDGLPVRIMAVGDWKGSPAAGEAILDITFLVAMYQDEVRTPFVDLPRKFMATLEDRKLDPSRLHLWIADRGAISLSSGYLPRLAGEVVRKQGAFRERLPAKWEELRTAEYLAFFGAHEEAIPHFEKYLGDEPEDPAVLFRLAQIHFIDREIERGIRFLRRAYDNDTYYIRGYAESALRFFRKGELENAERVLRAGLLLEPSTLDLKQGLAHVLFEQAKKLLGRDAAAGERRFSEIDAVGLPADIVAGLRRQWEAAKSTPSPPESPSSGVPAEHHQKY